MTEITVKQVLKNRAYKFSVAVLRFLDEFTKEKKVSYALADQLLRSATSVGANIVEAKSSSSKKEFVRYFEIALKSANETKYWLCLFRDGLQADKNKMTDLIGEADEISKMLASSILTMKGKRL